MSPTKHEQRGATAPRPAPTTSARPPRWRCSPAAATRSTPRWPPASCCRSSSRTCADRAATCPRSSSPRPTPRPGCCARRVSRRPRPPPQRLRDELGLTIVPGTGLLAATVPGAWDGWLTLLRDHGTMSLADVLEPALGYAAAGFPLVPRIPTTIATVADHFREHWPTSAATWLPDGQVPTSVHRAARARRHLAAAARRAAAAGGNRERQIDAARDAWYRGFVAEEIDAFCRTPVRDETGRDHAGLLTADDLAGWSASYEDALTVDVGGRVDGGEGGTVVAGAGAAADAAAASRQRAAVRRRRGHGRDGAPGGRGGQARFRRPRGLVRRQRARPAGRRWCPRVRRRPAGADRRQGVARAASRRHRTGARRGSPAYAAQPGGEAR